MCSNVEDELLSLVHASQMNCTICRRPSPKLMVVTQRRSRTTPNRQRPCSPASSTGISPARQLKISVPVPKSSGAGDAGKNMPAKSQGFAGYINGVVAPHKARKLNMGMLAQPRVSGSRYYRSRLRGIVGQRDDPIRLKPAEEHMDIRRARQEFPPAAGSLHLSEPAEKQEEVTAPNAFIFEMSLGAAVLTKRR